tara:strand:+ start:139 stop:762 length:624 start_codon:yes stop_codon:yes gene_type:complete
MMSLNLIIIVLTILVSINAQNNMNLYSQLMMKPYEVMKRRQYWRFLTSGFVHDGYSHLGFNMFTLYFFGGAVEQYFGYILGSASTIVFIFFYLSALIVSDLPGYFKNKNKPGYNTIGASGAVSAMVFASIIYAPLNKICFFALLCLPGFILGIIFIIYSFTQSKNLSQNINHEAHLYGALYGIAFSIWVYPESLSIFLDQILSFRGF